MATSSHVAFTKNDVSFRFTTYKFLVDFHTQYVSAILLELNYTTRFEIQYVRDDKIVDDCVTILAYVSEEHLSHCDRMTQMFASVN